MFRDVHTELNLVGIQQLSNKGHDRKMGRGTAANQSPGEAWGSAIFSEQLLGDIISSYHLGDLPNACYGNAAQRRKSVSTTVAGRPGAGGLHSPHLMPLAPLLNTAQSLGFLLGSGQHAVLWKWLVQSRVRGKTIRSVFKTKRDGEPQPCQKSRQC